jgi:hypothetical protein
MLRIITAYICRVLGTLVPHAEAANLLSASIYIFIFDLIFAIWAFQLNLLFSHIFRNRASVIGRIIKAFNYNNSVYSARARLKCNSSFFSGANIMPVFSAYFVQIFHAFSNRLLFASKISPIAIKLVSVG